MNEPNFKMEQGVSGSKVQVFEMWIEIILFNIIGEKKVASSGAFHPWKEDGQFMEEASSIITVIMCDLLTNQCFSEMVNKTISAGAPWGRLKLHSPAILDVRSQGKQLPVEEKTQERKEKIMRTWIEAAVEAILSLFCSFLLFWFWNHMNIISFPQV